MSRWKFFVAMASVMGLAGVLMGTPVGASEGTAQAIAGSGDSETAGSALPSVGTSALFNPVGPVRLVDTRTGRSTVDGVDEGIGAFSGTKMVQVTGRGDVPESGVGAVVLNVTVTNPNSDGYTTVAGASSPRPSTSNINFVAGATVPNAVVALVGVDGKVSVFNSEKADVIVDVSGWLPVESDYSGVVPARLTDTRAGRTTIDGLEQGQGAIAGTRPVKVADRGGLPPSGIGAVVVNVTVANPVTDGYTTLYPHGETRPNASNVNFSRGDLVANLVIAKVGGDGRIDLFNSTKADVIVDVMGWLPIGSDYSPLTTARLVDTRPGRTTVDGLEAGGGTVVGVRSFKVLDRGGVPTTAGSVVLNVTVTGSTRPGYATVFPTGSTTPNVSNLNFAKGQTTSNLVIAKIGTDGKISVQSSTPAQVIIDVAGWFPPADQALVGAKVAAGAGHSCALLADGTVSCWGDNQYGQLGNGTYTDSSVPVAVTGITDAAGITAGDGHACALLADNTVSCWGWNEYGQLGSGTVGDSSVPMPVPGINHATAVVGGGLHSCALLDDGTVTCWGFNPYGQLGNGTYTDSTFPVTVTGIANATKLTSGFGHSCALLDDGTVTCWGNNSHGELGNETDFVFSNVPVAVNGIINATDITAGSSHTCAILDDATVSCWGNNDYGQLGNGTTSDSTAPVTVTGITNATRITAGSLHTCALLDDGTVSCWGNNSSGQLGDGTATDSTVPVTVNGITNATDIAAGMGHTCALLDDATVSCWGNNDYGQLGR